MRTKKRRISIHKCDKCGKTPAIQIIHYQRLNSILNGEVCMCDPKDLCSYGFLKHYFKDDPRVKKLLKRLKEAGFPTQIESKIQTF